MISRRQFLATTLLAALPSCRRSESLPTIPLDPTLSDVFFWSGSGVGFGTRFHIEIHGHQAELGGQLLPQIEKKIAELEQSFSLYLKFSELRKLNRDRLLKNPSKTFLDILAKAKQLHQATGGYFNPAIHHIWLEVQKKLDSSDDPKTIHWDEIPKLAELWDATSLDNVEISESQIKLTHPLTQLSFNALGQGYATDIIATMLKNAGVTCAKIDCGETYCIGKHPEDRPWRLGIAGNGDLLDSIELYDAGLAVSSSAPDKILLDPVKRRIIPSITTAAVTSKAGACIADAFATAFTVAPKPLHPTLKKELQKFGECQIQVW